MRISLSFKMLLLTLGSFLLLITGILASIYLYFDRFYEPQKINHMIEAINEFTSDLDKNQWSDEQLYSEVSKFMKKQNATISILPESLVLVAPYDRIPAVRMRQIPDFFVLRNRLENISPINKLSVSTNTRLSTLPVDGISVSQNIMGLEASFEAAPYAGTTTMINGDLVLYPVAYTSAVSASSNMETHEKDDVFYTISSLPYTNYRQVNFTKRSTLGSGEVKLTNVNLSLQSVDEVMDFMLRLFPFLIGSAVLLSALMVAVYSRTISKPIISITKTANQMANMELGITSIINRKDELGDLSSSLNTLSSNLQTALDELNLANQQLKADYEYELHQEKVRKEFVANVSHELKTPLGIIKSYSEGIRDGVKTEKKDYYISVILDEITRMDQMIVEMLEISKFDAGAVTYQKKVVDMKNLVEKTVPLFNDKAERKHVTFIIDGNFGLCIADEVKIVRVLKNLVQNAVKYCDPDSIITIRGENRDNTLTISIENDCPRFSEEALAKVWDRFYKTDISHDREIEGTGLGLAITKSILEGHDCSYGVYNTDQGVCFHFNLESA